MDKLAEIEEFFNTCGCHGEHTEWLIAEVKRLRRQNAGLQYKVNADIPAAEAYGNQVSTENMKLREEVKRLRALLDQDVLPDGCNG